MQTSYDSDKRKLLSALSHGSIFFSALVVSVAVPIVILMTSDDPIVKDNAKEALNFHLNVWVLGGIAAICGALWWTIILLPFALLGGVILLASWILPILAIVNALQNPEQVYRYPFIFRVL